LHFFFFFTKKIRHGWRTAGAQGCAAKTCREFSRREKLAQKNPPRMADFFAYFE